MVEHTHNLKDIIENGMHTSNLTLATSLAYFHEPVAHIRMEGKTAHFIFDRTTPQAEVEKQFWDRGLFVEPNEFIAQYKTMKARAFDQE